jgi:hypothetical protein
MYPSGWELRGAKFIEFAVRAPFSKPFTQDGIPAGDYDVHFVRPFATKGERIEPQHVSVSSGRTSDVQLDSGTWGGLAVTVKEESGSVHEGALVVDVREPTGVKRGSSYSFMRGPYVVRGVPPGEYDVEVFAGTRCSQVARVRIDANCMSSREMAITSSIEQRTESVR